MVDDYLRWPAKGLAKTGSEGRVTGKGKGLQKF
jgi:hypothetical protein